MKRRSLLALLFASAAGPVWAQPSQRRHRIAIVTPVGRTAQNQPPETNRISSFSWGTFFEKLAQKGYIEGKNLSVDRFGGEGRRDRFAELARAAVATKPDVILAFSTDLVRHAKAATTTIPIVMFGDNPIEAGLVDNLARPGGNVTGVSGDPGLEFYVKTVDYLRLIAPGASRIGVLTRREVWESGHWVPKQEMVRRIGVMLVPALLNPPVDEAELQRTLAQLGPNDVDGLIVASHAEFSIHFRSIFAWANEKRIPTTYPRPGHVEAGGLMSYSPDFVELFSHLAEQVAMVLRGANPGDIPIYQPARFRLVINLATAREQEIDIPPTLLAAATEIIE